MRSFFSILLLLVAQAISGPLWTSPLPRYKSMKSKPLCITNVIRIGLPPYESNEDRAYRLEGQGCQDLKKGDELNILRPSVDHVRLGRLKVILVRPDHALARLVEPGDSYPLKGDLVQKASDMKAMPDPVVPALRNATLDLLAPKKTSPPPVSPFTALLKSKLAPVASSETPLPGLRQELHRGSIFFNKGSARLSPGAAKKLDQWRQAWGKDGIWVLLRPASDQPAQIGQMRLDGIKEELAKLGIGQVELREIPAEPESKYDAIYVVVEK